MGDEGDLLPGAGRATGDAGNLDRLAGDNGGSAGDDGDLDKERGCVVENNSDIARMVWRVVIDE